jgi:hypothetical protein
MDAEGTDGVNGVDVVDDPSKCVRDLRSGLLARRGLDGYQIGRLALMAAPDASPSAYGAFEPPLSAPVLDHKPSDSSTVSSTVGHQRSQSEAVKLGNLRKKSSRDVGIVGTTTNIASPVRLAESRSGSYGLSPEPSPIFQTPSSLNGMEAGSLRENLSNVDGGRDNDQRSRTPVTDAQSRSHKFDDGERRGANPASPGSWTSATPSHDAMLYRTNSENGSSVVISPYPIVSSPYLYYEPGLHAAAGPLPDPPRQILPSLPPPRKPIQPHSPSHSARLTLKNSLKLPDRVTAVLERRASSSTTDNNDTPRQDVSPLRGNADQEGDEAQ